MDVEFPKQLRLLWPAAHILRMGRRAADTCALLKEVEAALVPHRQWNDQIEDLLRLKSPANVRDILDWLDTVWQRLSSAAAPQLLSVRRPILSGVVHSSLPEQEQAALVTAVDYLFRLASARVMSPASRRCLTRVIPHTRSVRMQATYQKIASLAATDLPIWLAGEKGTELERLGKLVHQVRGLADESLMVLRPSEMNWDSLDDADGDFQGLVHQPPVETVLALDADKMPKRVQAQLHRSLVNGLGKSLPFRMVVSSSPVDLANEALPGVVPDLFAFLAPTRIEVPPLRSRTEDLENLINFFAASMGVESPTSRLSPDSLECLLNHHWPGNTVELEVVTSFMLKSRPSGPICPEHLPEHLGARAVSQGRLLQAIEAVRALEDFKVLKTREGRQTLAAFLGDGEADSFTPADVQRLFRMGRETARRLLVTLEVSGFIEGLKGRKGVRVTRYRYTGRGFMEPGINDRPE